MYKTKEIHSYTKTINKSMLYAITGFALVLMLPISNVFALPPLSGFLNSENCDIPKDLKSGDKVSCCWIENPAEGIEFVKCQNCTWTENVGYHDCSKGQIMIEQRPSEDGVLEQSPTSPSSGPAAPLQDGVLEQPGTPNKGSVMNLPNNNERSLDSQ